MAPLPVLALCVLTRKMLTTHSSGVLWRALLGVRSVRPLGWIGIHAHALSSCHSYPRSRALCAGSCGRVPQPCYGPYGTFVTSLLLRECFPLTPLMLYSNASYSCSSGLRWEGNKTLIFIDKLSHDSAPSTQHHELRLLRVLPHRDGQSFWCWIPPSLRAR